VLDLLLGNIYVDGEMKSHIRPLCDKHLVQMDAIGIQQKMGGSDVWKCLAFRCPTRGCTRLFESRGYVTVSDGLVDDEGRISLYCEHGVMFIENFDEDCLTWRCSKVGCDRSRMTDRGFRELAETENRRFLRHVGAISGGPSDLSSRKGFSEE